MWVSALVEVLVSRGARINAWLSERDGTLSGRGGVIDLCFGLQEKLLNFHKKFYETLSA
jgi:hypothetical protein